MQFCVFAVPVNGEGKRTREDGRDLTFEIFGGRVAGGVGVGPEGAVAAVGEWRHSGGNAIRLGFQALPGGKALQVGPVRSDWQRERGQGRSRMSIL